MGRCVQVASREIEHDVYEAKTVSDTSVMKGFVKECYRSSRSSLLVFF